jgi:RNA polymerase sigma factor (TIGR02999 family)
MSANPLEKPVLEGYCPPQLRADARRLAPLMYADLKRIARQQRGHGISAETLRTTALVHEAFLRVAGQDSFESHGHFLRVAAVTMRHLLIDRARAQIAVRHGGGTTRVGMDEAADFHVENDELVSAVHEALLRLSRKSPRLAEIVECRFFAGYDEKETAQALGIGERTVQRDWALARAWLQRELGETLGMAAGLRSAVTPGGA